MDHVVDYSVAHPKPQDIKNAGYVGVVRYLGWDFGLGNRCLSIVERNELQVVGLDIALVWETTANMTLRGAAGGLVDGLEANRQADFLGFPRSRPLYYAVDFEATMNQMAVIEAYKNAAESAGRKALMYGNVHVVDYFGEGWQCVAWSYGRRAVGAKMFQKLGYVLGNTCDENEVLAEDWGQWNYVAPIHTSPVPHPPSISTPPEVPIMEVWLKMGDNGQYDVTQYLYGVGDGGSEWVKALSAPDNIEPGLFAALPRRVLGVAADDARFPGFPNNGPDLDARFVRLFKA